MGNDRAVSITAALVSVYLKNNTMSARDIPHLAQHVPELIRRIHEAFVRLPGPTSADLYEVLDVDQFDIEDPAEAGRAPPAETLKPPVPIEKSVTPDHVMCFECRATFRSLRLHLSSAHGLTPEGYRQKWALPADYPMVAPNYSRERSQVAKAIGLGKGGRGAPPGAARKAK
jgi:predicted transcriptional regulator